MAVAKVRKVARTLLTLEEKDPKRLFEGNALLRRLVRIGVLPEDQMKLDYVLGLKIENFLERRLQTQGTDHTKSDELWLKKSFLTPTFIVTLNLSDNSFQTRTCQVYPSRPCSYQTKTHPCQKTG